MNSGLIGHQYKVDLRSLWAMVGKLVGIPFDYGHPTRLDLWWEFYKAIEQVYGSEADNVRAETNAMAPIWLRVNRQQVSFSAFTEALDKAEVKYTLSESHRDAIVLSQREDITGLPGFEKGHFAVQDGAAQLAAHYLQPQANERILDCCAAPGGKTGHIVECAPDTEYVLALDADATRLKRVEENMTRLQHKVDIRQGDAANPESWWDGKPFDRILLDASKINRFHK